MGGEGWGKGREEGKEKGSERKGKGGKEKEERLVFWTFIRL